MKEKSLKLNLARIKKQAAKIRIVKSIDTSALVNAPFFKEKMAKGKKMLLEIGLPKEIQEAIHSHSK